MWLSSLRKLLNRVPVSPIRRGRTTARGKSARPRVERLEDRVNPAPPLPPSPTTFTWTGGGGPDTNWSNAANWGGGVPAADGTADLVFPTLANQFLTQITINDFAPDTTFDSITFQGGSYTVLGNPFGLGGNSFIAAGDPNQAPGKSLIVNQPPGYTSNVVIIYPSVVLATRDQTFETNGTGFMQLAVGGHLNNGGFTLTVTGTGNTLLGTVPGLFVSGSLTGDGGLTKTGTGRLTLSGNVPNDYAGLTQVLGGVLHVMKPTALGGPLPPADVDVDATPGLGTTVADGASLWLSFDGLGNIPEEPLTLTGDGVDHFGTMSGALWSINGTNQWGGPITLAGPTTIGVLHAVSPFNPSSLNLTGVVDGSSAATLTKTGAGTLGLFGANTYQGTTTVQEGSLGVANNSALGSSGPTSGTTVNDGASLLLAASPPPMPPPPPPGFPPFFPPPIPTTVAEPLTLGNGTDVAPTLTNAPGGGNTWSGPITLKSNAVLEAPAGTILTVTGDIDTGKDAGNNGFLLTVAGPGFVNLLGGVRDAAGVPAGQGGRLVVAGDGRVTLGGTAANTYSGVTTVEDGGVLTVAKPSALGHAAGATTVNDGATLLVAPTQVPSPPPPPPPPPGFPPPPPFPLPPPVATTIAAEPLFLGNGTGGTATLGNTLNNNTWGGPVTLASNATVSVTGGQLTLSNAVGESGGARALTLEGGGFLVLGHANGYSGLTNVNTGMLVIQDSLALGTTAAGTVVGANGRLRLEGNLDISEGLTLNGLGFADIALEPRSGTSTWRGPVHLAATANVGVEGRLILDTGITGAPGAGLTRVFGGGVLEFAGSDPNTYSGPTTIKVGTLLLAKDADVTAVVGDLVVSGPIFSPGFPHPVYTGVVELGSDGQIADTATVTVASEPANFNGVFDLKGHTELIEKLVVTRGTVKNTEFGGRLTLAGAGGTALDMTGGSIDTGSGVLFLNGDLTGKAGATIAGEINLGPSGHTFTVAATPGPVLGMTISAKIVGGGGFVKAGPASLVLSGTGDNTYTGTTTVNQGNLLLQKNGVAVGGNLVIGDGVGGPKSDQVSASNFDGQIADWSAVTVSSTGWLVLFGRNDTVGPLTIDRGTVDTNGGNLGLNGPLAMTGGEVDVYTGTLTLGGDVTTAPDPGGAAPVFFGKLDLGGATRTVTVADGPTQFDLNLGDIGGSGNLIKDGDGVLALSGGNSYSGTTTVNAGTLYLIAGTGLAIPGALVVGDGLGGADADQLVLGNDEQILDTAAVTVNASGKFDFNARTEKVGALTVNGGNVDPVTGELTVDALTMTGGKVDTGSGKLILKGDVTATPGANGEPATISGNLELGTGARTFLIGDGAAAEDVVISAELHGSEELLKEGDGTLVFTGESTGYTGKTRIKGGEVVLGGATPVAPVLPNSDVVVEDHGTLKGTGRVKGVTVESGGKVKPGKSPGGITVGGDYTQEAGGILNIEIGGPTPVTEHDQLIVEGTATLGGVLNVSFVNGFVPAVGQSFAFLTAGSVVGTFATVNGLGLGNNTHLRPVFTAGGVSLVAEPSNQAPTVAVPGAQTAFEDVDLALAGISVGDPDGGSLSVTLGVAHGTLTLGTTAGLTVGGNGTGTVTLFGSVASLNAALVTLVYRGALNYGGADALSITADDGVTSTLAGVAINVKSAAQQASSLQAQVTALRTAGVLTQTQANSLNAKLNLTGNVGDVVRVGLFLAEVGVYRLLGVLTQTQASALLQPGGILLVSVTRR